MDFNPKTVLVSTFVKDYNKDKYRPHKIQRKEEQWNSLQKSELIDSILRPYPIDPIRAEVSENGIRYIFDGIQRASVLRSYLADGFKLHASLKPIRINDTEYKIAGKKFSQMDEELKERILGYEMILYLFTDCTEQDIREMFKRQNNGKPLSNTQKRMAVESTEVSEIIDSLASHTLFTKMLSNTQSKRDVAKDLVRETLMLIYSNVEHDFCSFKAKDIDNFVTWYANNIEAPVVEKLETVLNLLNERVQSKLTIKATSIPMMLYAAYDVNLNNKDFDDFFDMVTDFIETYDENDDYKQFCSRGTTSATAVNGRLAYWKEIAKSIKSL